MIFFAAIGWLPVAGVALVAGGWALWRGQRRRQSVSSLKLWRGLGGGNDDARRRRVDPLWVLVWLAGVLAAVALAGPGWRVGAVEKERVQGEWSVRSVGGSENFEAWVRVQGDAGVDAVRVNGVQTSVAGQSLSAGVLLRGVGERAEGALLKNGIEVERVGFLRPKAAPVFGLLKVEGSGAAVDGAVVRFFSIQAGVRVDDPLVMPRVVVAAGGNVLEEDLRGAGLVIGGPDAGMPGMKLGQMVEESGEGVVPEVVGGGFSWPAFISLKNVRVKRMREVELSAEWQAAAVVGGKPWIAVRKTEGGMWVWLASEASADWAKDSSFVVFMAMLQERALGGAGKGIVEWDRVPEAMVREGRVVDLSGVAGMGAIVLMVAASGWFVARGR